MYKRCVNRKACYKMNNMPPISQWQCLIYTCHFYVVFQTSFPILFFVPTPYRGWTLAVEMKSFKKFCYLLTIVETWKFLLQGSLFGDYEMLDIRY